MSKISKAVVKRAGGEPTSYQVDKMRYMQWEHVNDILEHPLQDSYQAKIIPNFKWSDWTAIRRRPSCKPSHAPTRG